MGRPLLGGNANPRQANDEKDLGQNEIGQAEFLFEYRTFFLDQLLFFRDLV